MNLTHQEVKSYADVLWAEASPLTPAGDFSVWHAEKVNYREAKYPFSRKIRALQVCSRFSVLRLRGTGHKAAACLNIN